MGHAARANANIRLLGGRDIPIVGAPRAPKVALGYAYGTLHAPFVASLLRLREYDFRRMAEGKPPFIHYQIPQQGLYIEDNRQVIAERFMALDAEWLLQVDTDIEFPPTLVERLLAIAGSEKKIVAASVPLGFDDRLGRPLPSCGLERTGVPGVWAYHAAESIQPEGTRVQAVATAVILVHRDVFQAIADREGQAWFLRKAVPRLDEEKSRVAWLNGGAVADRRYINVGEDLAFCMRAEEAGFDIWLAKVEGLRHQKVIPLSHDFETTTTDTPAPLRAEEGAGA